MKLQSIHVAFMHCEPGHHNSFNHWHDYDHRPENQALPGVFHSQRWVAPPDYIAARERFDSTYFDYGGGEYIATYWSEINAKDLDWAMVMRREQLIILGRFDHEYKSLGWGRDQKRYGRDRDYDFINAWTRPNLLLSPAAVPLMPHKGIHVVLSEVIDPARAEKWYHWYNTVYTPEILTHRGIMAVFRFARLVQMPKPTIFDLYYLDEDPLARTTGLLAKMAADAERDLGFPLNRVINVLLSGPYRTIIPGQYDFYS